MRWQVQEMARAERMLRDEQIAHEVETYNQLIPDAGELSATLMIELTSEPALREWLPRLVGIERHIAIVLPDGTQRGRRALRGGRAAPHPRRHHRGRALPEVPLRATPTSRCSRAVRCTSWSTIPSTTRTCCSTPEQHAELLLAISATVVARTSTAAVVDSLPASTSASASAVSIPTCRCPRRQHAGDAGYDLTARAGARLEPGGGRALVPTGIAIAIPEGYAGSCSRARDSRCATASPA